jgi:hypothetical protein
MNILFLPMTAVTQELLYTNDDMPVFSPATVFLVQRLDHINRITLQDETLKLHLFAQLHRFTHCQSLRH